MNGILVVDKPAGITSFGVIARLRKILGVKKMGHAGTLDPDATGVLPVCVGKATKVIEFLMEKDKAYRAVMRLGVETDTQDASGGILAVRPVEVSDGDIAAAIASFKGDMLQVPPMYSAIRVEGRRLYEIARQGREIERRARPVSIRGIESGHIERKGDEVRVTFDVECSKGTYIRTLCADIGSTLGCGGHMESLVRTRSGPFLIENARTLEEIEASVRDGTVDNLLMNTDEALQSMPCLNMDDEAKKRLKNGLTVKLACRDPADQGSTDHGTSGPKASRGSFVRLYGANREFFAIGRIMDDAGEPVIKSHKWLEEA